MKTKIAIIGASCRFPKADNLNEFWDLIAKGRHVFESFPNDRLHRHDIKPLKSIKGGFLSAPYLFNNQQFNISPKDAVFIDPQQRIMLELASEAQKSAKIIDLSNQKVAVLIGADQMAYQEMITSQYYRSNALDSILNSQAFYKIPIEYRKELLEEIKEASAIQTLHPDALVGNLPNMISARIAHHFNLKGPALTIDTACSSSLVAIHIAIKSLKSKESDMAFAGGINLNLTPSVFKYMDAAGVLSPSDKIIPFSKNSDGILLGEGAGMILLKRYDEAIRDGDPIYGIVKGSSINNDGRSLGIMAPAWKGQLELLKKTYEDAGVDPQDVTALEAHGTSTRIGDGVELSVIERFFPLNPQKPLSLGSVKSNFGHTLAASGMAGLLKMIMAVNKKMLPPSLHEEIDPKRKLLEKGIKIQSDLSEWISGKPRIAGISSFGFGGTNAHIILEEAEKEIEVPNANIKTTSKENFYFDFFPLKTSSKNQIYIQKWQKTEELEIDRNFYPSHWVIIGYDPENIGTLASKLSDEASTIIQVHAKIDDTNTGFTRLGENEFAIAAGNEDHYRWLNTAIQPDGQFGFIFLASDLPSNTPGGAFIEKVVLGFIYLLNSIKTKTNSQIWVNTSCAKQVNSSENIDPLQSALFTLAAGAMEENPKIRGGLIDQEAINNEGLDNLTAILGKTPSSPLIYRRQQIYRADIASYTPSKDLKKNIKVHENGTYLVLGGNSGIGFEVVKHLQKKKAKRIFFTGRKEEAKLNPNTSVILDETITYIQNDVNDLSSLRNLVSELFENEKQIDGIIFCPGIVSFNSLLNEDQAKVAQILNTKILGVQNLKESLSGHKPGFVYIFSSISSLTPSWSSGIVAYATANAYLNAFAQEHHTKETPWLSHSWGPWNDVGMASSIGNVIKGFPLSEALGVFNQSLNTKEANLIALPNSMCSAYSFDFTTKKNPTIAKQIPKSSANAIISNNDFQHKDLDLVKILKSYVAEAIDIPMEEIVADVSFYELGLDSLSAMDVAQKIQDFTGIEIHPTILFECDTILALAHHLGQTSPSKDNDTKLNQVIKSNSQDFPLIGAQKTFFATQEFYPEKPCNILVNVELETCLEEKYLKLSLDALIRKHDALRLSFKMTENGPLQNTKTSFEAPLYFVQYKDSANLIELENKYVNTPFPWGQAPYFKLVHARNKDKASLILVMHHIIFDAWSIYILIEELLLLYRSISSGKEIKIQGQSPFKDYVQNFHKQKKSGNIEKLGAYWLNNLKNASWSLELPYKKNKSTHSQHRMASGELEEKFTDSLIKFNKSNKLSIFHTILASFFITLNKETGRNDMIIRIANANRDLNYPGIDSLTACLADSLPIRIKVFKHETLLEVANKVKISLNNAFQNSGLSSQDIAELPFERQDQGPIVFSPVGLSFLPIHHLNKVDLPIKNIRCRTALAFTDLSLICFVENNKLRCCWNYDEANFEKKDIENLKINFLKVLSDVESSTKAIDIESIYPPLHLPHKSLFPKHLTLHEKVWAACKKFRGRTAIIEESTKLTYDEFELKSKSIANFLFNTIPKDEENVCILSYPSAEASTAIVGILGAGKAFIPIDPDWPKGRMAEILSHSKAHSLVTTSRHLPKVLNFPDVCKYIKNLFVVDEPTNRIDGNKGLHIHYVGEKCINDLDFETKEEQLAYIMYTSGTSGKAKGVKVQHKAVSLFLDWISETFEITKEDRFIHTSSLGFGGSIRQIFSTLLAGACNYPIPRLELKDPDALLSFLSKNEITILNTVPSVINNLIDLVQIQQKNSASNKLPKLRLLLLGGEVLYSKTALTWRRCLSDQSTIVNLYGSTETIVNASFNLIGPKMSISSTGSIPIGYQKKGTLVRLVNDKGELCKVGEVGEIIVGGPCLAIGYHQDDKLTNEKFAKFDFDGGKTVFYKTGDLGEIDDKGILVFSGRKDSQVQIYGNRVELSEIEYHLFSIEQVKNAVVLDQKTDNVHQLTAFVEYGPSNIYPSEVQVKDFLESKLANYMLPHKVKILDKIPLNQAGKTDRKALRHILEMESNQKKDLSIRSSEMSATEKIISSVWQKLLKIDRVGPNSDFFRLGGDSIMVLKMLHSLSTHFNTLPKAVVLFKESKLSDFANSIDALNTGLASDNKSFQAAFKSSSNSKLSSSQKGFLFLDKIDNSASPNWTGLIQIEGNIRLEYFSKAVQLLMQRHPMLRTVFIKNKSKYFPQILESYIPPVNLTDISHLSEIDQSKSLDATYRNLENSYFDPSIYPLFKISFFKSGDNKGAMAISMHHIITDGWSTHTLLNELVETYDNLINGNPPIFATRPPMFEDCIPYLDIEVSADKVEQLKKYWLAVFNYLEVEERPKVNKSNDNAAFSFSIPMSSKLGLTACARANGVTLNNLFLTLFSKTLSRFLGKKTFLVNTAINGRDVPIANIESVVACFAKNLPILIEIDPEAHLETNIKSIERKILEALEHQDLPSTELLKIASKSGLVDTMLSLNRFYFSFMDFTALNKYESTEIALNWEESIFSLNVGGAGSEIMMSVNVEENIRISFNGYAPTESKKILKTILEEEIERTISNSIILDTALITYFPGESWMKSLKTYINSNDQVDKWVKTQIQSNNPLLLEWQTTPLGVSGTIFIPYSSDELKNFPMERRIEEIRKGIQTAQNHGARKFSLAGILPAISNYAYSINKEISNYSDNRDPYILTTGHATTVVGVVKTIKKTLDNIDAKIEGLHVAIIGFGSIGQSSLSLLMNKIGHPASILIVELSSELKRIQSAVNKLKTKFSGDVKTLGVQNNAMPDELFDCDLMIGASSSGQIIDTNLFKRGSILIDDSFPSIIDIPVAISRMKNAQDVLLLGGGKLKFKEQQKSNYHNAVPIKVIRPLLKSLGEEGMPGCRAEPLLIHNNPNLPQTIGLVKEDTASIYWDECSRLGIDASSLHLGAYEVPKTLLSKIRSLHS